MKIGLLGLGTIGSGVYDILKERSDIEVKRVLDLRDFPELGDMLTRNFEDIESDPEIDTVVELMGGVEPAFSFAVRAMRAGKNFVTANKLMVATHFDELFKTAKECSVQFRLGASVGGGIPYLASLVRARRVDELTEVYGIVNGTTNLILDTMQKSDADFADVLKEAQALGYAEADPSSDIDGIDARSKLAISAGLAFKGALDAKSIPTAGIRYLKKADVEAFRAMKRVCRFLVRGKKNEDGSVAAFVEPTLLPEGAIEAAVAKNDNLAGFKGVYAGDRRFFGQGAGKYPTAQTVVNDLVDILYLPPCDQHEGVGNFVALDNSKAIHSYYVRTKADLSIPAEKLQNGAYLTEAVSVAEMHEELKRLQADDPETFLAGLC